MFPKRTRVDDETIDRPFAEALNLCTEYDIPITKIIFSGGRKLQEWLNLGADNTLPVPLLVSAAIHYAFYEEMTEKHPKGMDRDQSPWLEINELKEKLIKYTLENVPAYKQYAEEHYLNDAEMMINFMIQQLAGTPTVYLGPSVREFIKS